MQSIIVLSPTLRYIFENTTPIQTSSENSSSNVFNMRNIKLIMRTMIYDTLYLFYPFLAEIYLFH